MHREDRAPKPGENRQITLGKNISVPQLTYHGQDALSMAPDYGIMYFLMGEFALYAAEP